VNLRDIVKYRLNVADFSHSTPFI